MPQTHSSKPNYHKPYKQSTHKKFIFTLTAGRTGTRYLTTLFSLNLPNTPCFHELIGYGHFGVNTPDISHLTVYNSQGNTSHVRSFWQQKLNRINQLTSHYYIETSHILAKAGLIDNLSPLFSSGDIHIINLRRDLFKTVISIRRRGSFLNIGDIWMWYLDPNYPKNIVPFAPFSNQIDHLNAMCIWYICEIQARFEYYRILYSQTPKIHFHSIDIQELNKPQQISHLFNQLEIPLSPTKITLPSPQNTNQGNVILNPTELTQIKNFINNLKFNPKHSAINYLKNGQSLA